MMFGLARLRLLLLVTTGLWLCLSGVVAANPEAERDQGLRDENFHIRIDCVEETDVQWRALNCPFPRTSYKMLSDAGIGEFGEALSTASGGLVWSLYSALTGLVFTVLWNALTMPWMNFFVSVADRLSTAVVDLVGDFWWAAVLAVGAVAAWRFLNPTGKGGDQSGQNLANGFKFLLGAIVWLGLFTAVANWHGPNPFEPDVDSDVCADRHLQPNRVDGCVNGMTRAALLPITTMLRIAASFDTWASGAVDYVTEKDTSQPYGRGGVWSPYIFDEPNQDRAGELHQALGFFLDKKPLRPRRLQPETLSRDTLFGGSGAGRSGAEALFPCADRATPPALTEDTKVSVTERASLMEPLACRVLQPWKLFLFHNVWETFHWGQSFDPHKGDLIDTTQTGRDEDYPDSLNLSNGQTVSLLLWGSSNPNGDADSELMHNLQIKEQLASAADSGRHNTGDVVLSMLVALPGLIAALLLLGLMLYASFHMLIVVGLIPAVWVSAPIPPARRMTVRMGLSLLRSGILVAGTLLFVNIMLIYQDVLFDVAKSLPGLLAALVAVAGQGFLLAVPFKLFSISKQANLRFKARLDAAQFNSFAGLKTLGKGLGKDVATAGREAFGSGLRARSAQAASGGDVQTITKSGDTKQKGGVFGQARKTEPTSAASADKAKGAGGAPAGTEKAKGVGRVLAGAERAKGAGRALAGAVGAETGDAPRPIAGRPSPPELGPEPTVGRLTSGDPPGSGGTIKPADGGGNVLEPPPAVPTDLAPVESPELADGGGTVFKPPPGGSTDLAPTESGELAPTATATELAPTKSGDLAPTVEPGKLAPTARSTDLAPAEPTDLAPTANAELVSGELTHPLPDPAPPPGVSDPKPGFAPESRIQKGLRAAKELGAAGVGALRDKTELGKSASQQVKSAKEKVDVGRRFAATARRGGVASAVRPPTAAQQRQIASIQEGKMGAVALIGMVTAGRGGQATVAFGEQQKLEEGHQKLAEQLAKTERTRAALTEEQNRHLKIMMSHRDAETEAAEAKKRLNALRAQHEQSPAEDYTETVKRTMALQGAQQEHVAAQDRADQAKVRWAKLAPRQREMIESHHEQEQKITKTRKALVDLEETIAEKVNTQQQAPAGERVTVARPIAVEAARQLLRTVPITQLGAADRNLLVEHHRADLSTIASRMTTEEQQTAAKLGWAALLAPPTLE